jgi:ATP-dependent Clp protease adapter protein ClpS
MMKLTLIAALLSIMHMTNAFAPAVWGIRQKAVLFSGEKEGDSGGGAAIAKPALKQKQKTVQKSKQKSKTTNDAEVHDPISRRDEAFEEAPMFMLMLLSDKDYEASHVVERMCAIVEGMDEDQAATVFQQAKSSGKAMCGMYPFERAELFKEQLQRSDPMIFTDLVEA